MPLRKFGNAESSCQESDHLERNSYDFYYRCIEPAVMTRYDAKDTKISNGWSKLLSTAVTLVLSLTVIPSLTFQNSVQEVDGGSSDRLNKHACISLFNGSWDSHTKTCVTFDDDGYTLSSRRFTIVEGATLIVASGFTLTVNDGASLNNEGTILNNFVIVNNGTINNSGTLDNAEGIIHNNGKINNDGTIDSFNFILNYSGGVINNNGTINIGNDVYIGNLGSINNYETINIGIGGGISNFGSVSNYGTINNSGEIQNCGIVSNSGSIIGNAIGPC